MLKSSKWASQEPATLAFPGLRLSNRTRRAAGSVLTMLPARKTNSPKPTVFTEHSVYCGTMNCCSSSHTERSGSRGTHIGDELFTNVGRHSLLSTVYRSPDCRDHKTDSLHGKSFICHTDRPSGNRDGCSKVLFAGTGGEIRLPVVPAGMITSPPFWFSITHLQEQVVTGSVTLAVTFSGSRAVATVQAGTWKSKSGTGNAEVQSNHTSQTTLLVSSSSLGG